MTDEKKTEKTEELILTPPQNDTTDVVDQPIPPAKPMSQKDRPTKYTHLVCETQMEMSDEDAAVYHSEPNLVAGLPCTHCGGNYRIGDDGEMAWTSSKDKVPGGVA